MKQVSVCILQGSDVADVLLRGGESRIATLVDAAVDVARRVRGVLEVVVAEHSAIHGVHANVTLGDEADEHLLRIALGRLTPQAQLLQ